jgi:hypothetical protein
MRKFTSHGRAVRKTPDSRNASLSTASLWVSFVCTVNIMFYLFDLCNTLINRNQPTFERYEGAGFRSLGLV